MKDAPEDYSANMAKLIAHERDNPSAVIGAFLCTNELDAAAQHLIRRVQSPEQRNKALLYLQYTTSDSRAKRRFHEHATFAGLSPGHILWHRFDQLRQRSDLLNAVEQVGYIEVVPLHRSIWLRY